MAAKAAPQKNSSQEGGKHRPAQEIRLGRIKATIWANQSDGGTWYNVTLSRNYKDGNEWKSSSTFGRDDLLVVAKVADLAHTWIHNQLQNQPASNQDEGAEEEIPY